MKRWLKLFKQSYTDFSNDNAQRLGAALAYYTIFSIAPLLLIAIAIAGLVFGREAVQGQVVGQLQHTLGPSTAGALQDMIRHAAKPKSGTVATIIGVITLLLGASGVFQQLKQALNTIWNVEPPKGGIMLTIRRNLFSMSMVLGVGFLLLVSLVIDAAINAAGHYASNALPGGAALWEIVQLIVSLGIVTVLFALIFRYVPDTRVDWRDVWYGSVFTAVLFIVGKFALGLYIGRGSVGSSYGAAGSLIVLLLWVYWSAQILFFGAEFTQVYACMHGSRIGNASKADAQKGNAAPKGAKPTEALVERPKLLPAYAKEAESARETNGGRLGLALGGIGGMFVGALVGSIGAIVMAVKVMKKLVTFH